MHGSHSTVGNAAIARDWQNVRATFKRIWGYEDFRSPQGEIIRSLLERRDTLVVMPTGAGKSICFQLPALLQSGLTIVVSPLVALMENQVQELRQQRLPAALLHNEVPAAQRRQTLNAIDRQQLRLLYLSPETLLSTAVWERLRQPQVEINGLILDEAHCLVQWGDTFRPAYRRLGAVRSALLQPKPAGAKMAIAAFTATADPKAQQTIQTVLGLQNPQAFLLNPYRSNLHLSVQTIWSPRQRRQRLLGFVRSQNRQSGLVYVRTRRDSEELADWLAQQGLSTAAYHAGLGASDRRRLEKEWLNSTLQFVVCTSAFGMGINKSDVRWIVHVHAPTLISEYVQEVGRAGRDGLPSQALTLVSEPTGWLDPEDQQRQKFFIEQGRSQQRKAQQLLRQLPTAGDIQTVTREFPDSAIALALLHRAGQLQWQDPFHYKILSTAALSAPEPDPSMPHYLRTRRCRWQFLLDAFGFPKSEFKCGHCDRCEKRN